MVHCNFCFQRLPKNHTVTSHLQHFIFFKGAPEFVEWGRLCHGTMASPSLAPSSLSKDLGG